MAVSNLTPGKKAKGGTSVRLSAYIDDPVTLRLLAEARRRFTPYQLAEVLGRELPGILRELGVYEVRCPICHEVSLEVDVADAKRDEWQCPRCGHATSFLEWPIGEDELC